MEVGNRLLLAILWFIPSRGTDMEVDGIISARSKKNTVNESRIEMDKDTCKENRFS